MHFDHHSPEHAADPVASYRALRSRARSRGPRRNGGYWMISGYDAVFAAARDDDVFSSARTTDGGEGLTVVIPKTPMHLHIPIELDPPDFRKYRKVINPITAPAAIERMTRMIDFYTTWFVDQVIEHGECDFTEIIGVPAIVTVDWLGLPVEDWARYARRTGPPRPPRGSAEYTHAVEVDHPYLAEQMRKTIAARAPEPSDDAISFLLASRSTTGRSPTTRSSRWSTCSSPAARHHVELVSQALDLALPSTRTSGGGSWTTPSCSTGRSRSSSAASRRPRRWPAPSPTTSSSTAAR